MKKLIMFCMVLMLCLGIAGKAQGELVCLEISPTGAGEGDEVTLTGYDEEGAVIDLSELEVFESNFHHETGGFYPTLWKDGDNSSDNIDIVDGSIVFTLTDEMLMSDVTMWDCFFIPGGEDAAFRLCNIDPEDETTDFETVVEVIAAGGTCDLGPPNPIVIDPNVMLVYEEGETVGDFDVSMYNALPTGKTATVTVDPNSNGDGPSDDITLIGGSVVDGSITLTFTDSNWDVPQTVVYKAIDDDIAEPPELEEAQEILVTSVYSDTLQDPNWAGEKIVKVNVFDNDQANILFTITPAESDNPKTPITGPVQIWEQPRYKWGLANDRWRKIGVTLQVPPSGGDVKIEVTKDGDNPPIMDPPLTTTSEPNSLIFNAGNYNVSQDIKVWGNDDDVLQAEGAEADGDQNYFGVLIFTVIDDGGDSRFTGLDRGVDLDIEDNECGAWGISYLDIGNPNAATDPNYQDEDGNPLPDCYVDIYDVIWFATKWLDCSDPQEPGCESYL